MHAIQTLGRSLAAIALGALCVTVTYAQTGAPLQPMGKDKMPASITPGKFDHLGIDLAGNRLFAAAESAHQVLVFDLASGRYLRSIEGADIPHAIFVRKDRDRIYITDGGKGAVNVYDAKTYQILKRIPLKVDADSMGYDPKTHLLYVDDGGGDAHQTFSMLSVIDTDTDEKVADIKIDGDTLEAMAFDSGSGRMFVNNPAKDEVSVVDRRTRKLVASWPVTLGKHNVAMAIDPAHHRLFVACRSGVIVVFDTESGKELQSLPIGKGVDDLAFDQANNRLYAMCGASGATWVYDAGHDKLLAQIPSGPGGKNGLLAPALRKLFIVVPPQGSTDGVIDVFHVN